MATNYFEHSRDSREELRKESKLFSGFLKKAIELHDPDLWGIIIGQVEPIARGSATWNDPVQTVAEDDGIRQFEILNRTLLASNDQVRKDIKLSIEGALQKVKSSGNPITALNTTTKHALDQYTELEQHIDWAETAQPMMRHLVTRCRIGADMTDVCKILDVYLTKSPKDIADPNQEYTQLINDIHTKWAAQMKQETHSTTAKETMDWEEKWWARHMVSNDDESAQVHAHQVQQQPRTDGMTVHVPYKILGYMAPRFRTFG